MAPEMSRKAMVDILEKHKQSGVATIAASSVQKDKRENVINLT